jgi:hypothetical protein
MEALAGWQNFAEDHDVNVTAMLEAVGLVLGELHHSDARLPPVVTRMVRDARTVAGRRSTRVRRDES